MLWSCQTNRFLSDDGGLDFEDLCDMVRARLELIGFHSLIDAHKHVSIYIPTVINTCREHKFKNVTNKMGESNRIKIDGLGYRES